MKKIFLAILIMGSGLCAVAQTFQPDWESLDKRKVPDWFSHDKFGIFIHWGVYSVPGWSGKTQYAEWYQNGLESGDTARIKYHKARFGNRSYYDLAKDFKAELFNPDEWASLFERSGAKYIVLTSKHHDGYCLWPSKTASQTWGFPWNAKETGPNRDLLGELFAAVRKTSVRPGMYYSLYEWYNPLWKTDRTRYVNEHMWPQMKELVNTYKPDVFWTDGEWDAPAETWRSQEFLAWLYNESPVRNSIVTYDRWGSGVRFHHGSVYTPEYQPDLDFENHAFEESRGMGHSYGYNRGEDAWDYNSTQSLVVALVDKVSRGGNFLLDIGPDEHGKIPPIMQERLLQIGDWLKVNGEAIYGTSRWRTPSQGRDLYYTWNSKTNSLYVIFPKYPSDRKLTLKNLTLPNGTLVRMLATNEHVSYRNESGNLVINLPEYDPNSYSSPYAYAIKILDFGTFAEKPVMNVLYPDGSLQPIIQFTTATTNHDEIRYTTDGTEPNDSSILYMGPVALERSATIKAKRFRHDQLPSNTVSNEVKRYEWQKPVKRKKLSPGISWKYFEPEGKITLNSIETSKPVKQGTASEISEKVKVRAEKYALSFDGYINIKADGIYEFFTLSDDGSKLYINDQETVNNDGEHGSVEKSGVAALKKGYHRIRVVYFDSGGGNELKVYWSPNGGQKDLLPAGILFSEPR
ncbi:alpha-L-fucosidase [Flavihumibacter solisilvae]|uniref:alpha-L-fucosidase n=1 Tax=Flavihumibacter solisilvae TaxID=1349421 RepID=UPI000689FC6C|nr:alpha-L-fucosidase [Flavihumibacter solisilvae]